MRIDEKLDLIKKNNVKAEVMLNSGKPYPDDLVTIDLVKLINDLAEYKFMYESVSK